MTIDIKWEDFISSEAKLTKEKKLKINEMLFKANYLDVWQFNDNMYAIKDGKM